MMNNTLAILGGPRAITIDTKEQYQRPIDEEKKAVCDLIDQGFLSGSGSDLPRKFEEELELRKYIEEILNR